MEQFSKIFIMSFVTVSIYDIIKSFYKDNKVDVHGIITAILGIILAVAARLDAFNLVGIDFAIPYLGQVLTGLVISKGSNYVYDFITKIFSLMQGKTIEASKEESVAAPEESEG